MMTDVSHGALRAALKIQDIEKADLMRGDLTNGELTQIYKKIERGLKRKRRV